MSSDGVGVYPQRDGPVLGACTELIGLERIDREASVAAGILLCTRLCARAPPTVAGADAPAAVLSFAVSEGKRRQQISGKAPRSGEVSRGRRNVPCPRATAAGSHAGEGRRKGGGRARAT